MKCVNLQFDDIVKYVAVLDGRVCYFDYTSLIKHQNKHENISPAFNSSSLQTSQNKKTPMKSTIPCYFLLVQKHEKGHLAYQV